MSCALQEYYKKEDGQKNEGEQSDPHAYTGIAIREGSRRLQEAGSGTIEDLFTARLLLAKEKVNLIVSELFMRKKAAEENIRSLYADLLKIANWRLEIPFPKKYYKDRDWLTLNNMELLVRDKIRGEKAALFRDTAMTLRDFREAVVEYWTKQKQSELLDVSGLEEAIDGYAGRTD